MKTLILSVLAVTPLIATGNAHAEAADKQPSDRICLFSSQPQNWQVLDPQHLVLWGPTQKDAYLVTLFAPLQELKFSEKLAFIDDDHNGMICGNGGDKIGIVDTPVPAFPSTITSMRKVDDAELVALGEQYKVKLLSAKRTAAVKDHDKQVHGATSTGQRTP